MERDKYLSADEAVELGIVDQILDRREKGEAKPEAADAMAPKP